MSRKSVFAAAVVAVVVLAGCKEAFSGHADVVATAVGQELQVERVAGMLAPVKQIRLQREVIDRVADLWVDYQLLGQAVARGDSLFDSATVEQAMWPIYAQMLVNQLHDSMAANMKPNAQQVDSAYNSNDFRYISHILVAVRQDTSESVRNARRRVAEGYLQQVRGGADFARLASRVSDDPSSKPNGGSVGMMPRGVMVKPFEDAAFALEPGQISNLVETAYGYHILYRPRLDAIRDSFTIALEDVMAVKFDSVFLDSLTNKTQIAVRGSAPAVVRAAAQNLRAAKERNRTIATYRGGRLTESAFARWLQAFPLQTRGAIATAPDSSLIDFVKSIARNQMLMETATERGLVLPAEDRDSIEVRFRRDLTALLNGMGIAADSLAADSSADKAAAAARRVDLYFSDLTTNSRGRQYFEVPPFLADVLRERFDWSVSNAGVDRALERARTLRGPEEPPEAQRPPAGMQPAPVQPGARPPLPQPDAQKRP
jgi:peptidyl-prolyl cis-trans isomerase D